MKRLIPNAAAAPIAGLLALMTLTACGRRGGPPPAHPSLVQTAAAVGMEVPILISTFGTTEDQKSVEVVPQVSGKLLQTLVADGATVTNGQPLFLIDPSDYAARVRQVESMVAADKTALNLSRSTLDRNRPLLEKKLIAADLFDALKARAEAAEAQLQADSAALEQARLNLDRCTVTAPLAGLCSKRYVDDGNLVGAGQTRLINIRSYDPLFVECSVSEQYLPAVREALAAGPVPMDLTPRGEANTYRGELKFVDNAVNPLTGTILLRGQVANPDLRLWAGQFVDVRITAGTVANAVMVPEGAVQFGKMGTYLFVAAANKADMRIVKTGIRYKDLIQVVQGVAPGEKVVVLGQLMLYPGAAVMDVADMPKPGPAGAASGEKSKQPNGHGGA